MVLRADVGADGGGGGGAGMCLHKRCVFCVGAMHVLVDAALQNTSALALRQQSACSTDAAGITLSLSSLSPRVYTMCALYTAYAQCHRLYLAKRMIYYAHNVHKLCTVSANYITTRHNATPATTRRDRLIVRCVVT